MNMQSQWKFVIQNVLDQHDLKYNVDADGISFFFSGGMFTIEFTPTMITGKCYFMGITVDEQSRRKVQEAINYNQSLIKLPMFVIDDNGSVRAEYTLLMNPNEQLSQEVAFLMVFGLVLPVVPNNGGTPFEEVLKRIVYGGISVEEAKRQLAKQMPG